MRQISIKRLKNNLCKELQDLPLEVTKYGRVVATITQGNDDKVATTPQKVVISGDKEDKAEKSTTCNHKQKATSHTGGRPLKDMTEIDRITMSYFSPQPKDKT